MSYEYMVDALAEVSSYLTANLEATLVAIETARGLDPGSIPRWTSISTSINLTDQYPYIEILPDTTDREYGDDESPLAEEHWNHHYLSVLVSHAGYDQGVIQLALTYYVEAVERLVKGDNTFGDKFNRVRLMETSYALLISAQEDKMIKQTVDIGLEVRVYSS